MSTIELKRGFILYILNKMLPYMLKKAGHDIDIRIDELKIEDGCDDDILHVSLSARADISKRYLKESIGKAISE